MLNEARIKEQYQLALLDKNEGKNLNQLKTFYRSDYIAKQMIGSFFAATFVFVFGAALVLMGGAGQLMDDINTIDYQGLATKAISIYIAFTALYLIVTYLVYALRYHAIQKKQEKYRKHLKRLAKFYKNEEQ